MKKPPEWFQSWLDNDFRHLAWKVDMVWWLIMGIFIAVIAGYFIGK